MNIVKIKDLNKGIKTKVIQAKTHFICHVKIKDLNKGIKTHNWTGLCNCPQQVVKIKDLNKGIKTK